jgi:hypothetical protein
MLQHASYYICYYLHSQAYREGFDNLFLLLSQHVPKVNGEIPSVDEAISDHQRLLDR